MRQLVQQQNRGRQAETNTRFKQRSFQAGCIIETNFGWRAVECSSWCSHQNTGREAETNTCFKQRSFPGWLLHRCCSHQTLDPNGWLTAFFGRPKYFSVVGRWRCLGLPKPCCCLHRDSDGLWVGAIKNSNRLEIVKPNRKWCILTMTCTAWWNQMLLSCRQKKVSPRKSVAKKETVVCEWMQRRAEQSKGGNFSPAGQQH